MYNDIDYKKIGKRIRLKRVEREMNQSELADKAGINAHYLSNIENNNVDSVGLKTLFTLAHALDTNVDYFLLDITEDNGDIVYKEVAHIINEMKPTQRTFTMDVIRFLNNNTDKF